MRTFTRPFRLSVAGITAAASMAGLGAVVMVAPALAQSPAVAITSVNMRTGAGMGYSVITLIPDGASLTATGPANGNWTPVTYNGRSGWVWSDYIEVSASTSAPETIASDSGSAVTTDDVNVRSGPSTSYSVVDVAEAGTRVALTGATSGGWTQVDWDGSNRWIYSSYLDKTASSTPSVSTPAITGQARTTATVNMRVDGYYGATVIGQLPSDTIVDITGNTSDSYTQIVYNGRVAWIFTAYQTPVTAALPLVSSPVAPTSSLSTQRAQIVKYAKAQLGKPYLYGTMGPDSFDCSGLVAASYRSAGYQMPYSEAKQSSGGTWVSREDLQPGDVVVWGDPVRAVSIYIGDDTIVIADGPGYGVRTDSLSKRMGWEEFAGGRRYV